MFLFSWSLCHSRPSTYFFYHFKMYFLTDPKISCQPRLTTALIIVCDLKVFCIDVFTCTCGRHWSFFLLWDAVPKYSGSVQGPLHCCHLKQWNSWFPEGDLPLSGSLFLILPEWYHVSLLFRALYLQYSLSLFPLPKWLFFLFNVLSFSLSLSLFLSLIFHFNIVYRVERPMWASG